MNQAILITFGYLENPSLHSWNHFSTKSALKAFTTFWRFALNPLSIELFEQEKKYVSKHCLENRTKERKKKPKRNRNKTKQSNNKKV